MMSSTQRYVRGFGIVALLALISWLTISPGTPRVYAPLNVLVILPLFLADSVLGNARILAAVGFVPVFFCFWCLSVLQGAATLPTRSVALLVCAVALSASWLTFGYSYGLEHQSIGYFIGVAVLNVFCWVLLAALAVLARRRPSYGHNLGFHAALFAWLAWCAFPYLGELP